MENLTALRADSLRHLVLGGGVLVEGHVPAEGAAEAFGRALAAGERRVLGHTESGCFEVKREFAEVRLAGQTGPCAGLRVPAWTEASLSGELIEVSAENLSRLLAMAPLRTAPGGAALGLAEAAGPGRMDALTWIGELADGGRLLIRLRRAVNADSVRLAFDGKGHARMNFRFVAQADPEAGEEEMPFEVVKLLPGENA